MFKRMTLIKRLPNATVEQFRRHWSEVHGQLVIKLPGIRRYIQNDIRKTWPEAPFDGVVELWFDDKNGLETAFSGPLGKALPDDEKNFIGGKVLCDTEEHSVRPGIDVTAPKIISYVWHSKHDNAELWRRWHAQVAMHVEKHKAMFKGVATYRIPVQKAVGSEEGTGAAVFGIVVYYLENGIDVESLATSGLLDAIEEVPADRPSTSTRILASSRLLLNDK